MAQILATIRKHPTPEQIEADCDAALKAVCNQCILSSLRELAKTSGVYKLLLDDYLKFDTDTWYLNDLQTRERKPRTSKKKPQPVEARHKKFYL